MWKQQESGLTEHATEHALDDIQPAEELGPGRAEGVRASRNYRILVVDDEAPVRELLRRWLTNDGYDCVTAASGVAAWEALRSDEFALLITDLMMPGMSGMELLSKVTQERLDVAVIIVTAMDDRATAADALSLGAYGYVIKPFEKNEALISVSSALRRRELELLERGYSRRLEREVREQTAVIRKTQEEVVLRLVSVCEFRNEETGDHVRRMGLYAAALAEAFGWKETDVGDIILAAPMHDIGKVAVPDAILMKPGRLTAEEFDKIKEHSAVGAQILGHSNSPLLRMAREIALSHHEKWDGSGYPNGLAGGAIPLSGRITAVCDVYDALVSERVYRPALPEEDALAIMTKGRGTHFDPQVFACFLDMLPSFREVRRQLADEHESSTPQSTAYNATAR